MTETQTAPQAIRDRVGGAERASYAPAVETGRIVEPRAGEPLYEGGPRFKGCVALGAVSRRGDHLVREVRIVGEGRVLALCPRFRTNEEAHAFGLRLAMRAGGRLGQVADDWALLALDSHLWLVAASWPRPSATPDGVREALADYAAGHPLDEASLYGAEPPFGEVLACPDGSTWERVLTLAGAAAVTHETLDGTARDFDYESCLTASGRPEAEYMVLRAGASGARYIAAVVRLAPGGRQDPQVNGPVDKDPFPRFGEHIGLLSAHTGVAIGPEHYPHGGEPVGEVGEMVAAVLGG